MDPAVAKEKGIGPNAEIHDTDIIFECPHCAKSLAIDQRGAGLMISCPDCGARIQVPLPEGVDEPPAHQSIPAFRGEYDSQVRNLREALENSRGKVQHLMDSMEEVRKRRSYLEKLRVESLSRYERISDELAVIQSALDRMVGILQEATIESSKSTSDTWA
jgi:DNA-directed RNA polymerase subunit RPC12/RpoP